MSVIGSNILAGASGQGGGYKIDKSLRFRKSASAYLNRTFGSGGNLRTWTWSAWVKRGSLGSDQQLFGWWEYGGGFNNQHWIGFDSSNTITYKLYNGQTNTFLGQKTTAQVFRDPSAWYHIVCVWDTTNATASSRMRMYINGSQVTSFGTSIDPSQNTDGYINLTSPNALHILGAVFDSSFSANPHDSFDGYLTEINFIDGQALTPSSFGEYSTTTGVWQPKRYAGTYGTNGFYLPFTDNSALTTSSNVGLGKDFSGNGNYWTTNNISITSGATYDSMTDVPTLTSATASNFAVLNPIAPQGYSLGTISNGNLTLTDNTTNSVVVGNTMPIPTSGKFYFECAITTFSGSADLALQFVNNYSYNSATVFSYYSFNGTILNFNGTTQSVATYTQGDVIGFAFDATNKSLQYYKNNVALGSPTTFTNAEEFLFLIVCNNTGGNKTVNCNFGQRPFAYTPPTGFVALNTFNLPTPTIGATASTQANKYFDVTTYTGNSSTNVITNSGSMQPSLVWMKARNTSDWHYLIDAVRGGSKILYSNTTSSEATDSTAVQSFNSNGFTIGSNAPINTTGNSYVGWQWAGNGTGVTNTAGSITSTVSANTSSGFSVVTYTGNGTNATVGHGLGVAPSMIIVKRRSASEAWGVYHKSLGATKAINLELTVGAYDYSIAWNNTSPTSSVFSLGTWAAVNSSGGTFVAYCFSEVQGYSKFGSYVGNGSSDGSFVYTGFKPKYVMIKRTDTTGYWCVMDSARDTDNSSPDYWLYPNVSDQEDALTVRLVDFLSNGFKNRNANGFTNASGGTYIYMAFAENPFKYSLAR